jgi:hypothetical protein
VLLGLQWLLEEIFMLGRLSFANMSCFSLNILAGGSFFIKIPYRYRTGLTGIECLD